MMDPKKEEELGGQEDHYRQKWNLKIYLNLTTEPDPKKPSGPRIHSAIMTVNGRCFIARNSPVFRSDEKGAFYREVDAILSARIKLVGWLNEMNDKGFLPYKDEQTYITTGHVSSLTPRLMSSEDGAYIEWLTASRVEYLDNLTTPEVTV